MRETHAAGLFFAVRMTVCRAREREALASWRTMKPGEPCLSPPRQDQATDPGTGGTAQGLEPTAITILASLVTYILAIILTEPLCPRISACVYVKRV